MSDEAYDLVNKMIQVEPKNRITVKKMKQHPFFRDIDFIDVSSPMYKEAIPLVTIIIEQFK